MSALIQTLGGVGLFLFGMAVMTSGLRKLAGDRLSLWLSRTTKSPLSGAVTGAMVTALIQSSSATTVAAIGFVGAGLMTFSASLGIVFGANIGTTFTGWMVAWLGFELKLADAALPLLFVAAICHLFKQYRPLRGFGKALAGFCLIFIGIGFLQGGLEGYHDVIDLERWSIASLGGRIALVLVGMVLTLITQSSSATVATVLTALNASIVDLPQAAALIIGADIGTTGTAALATLGGTTAARRTGFAHVVYNLLTGIAAFFLLPLYLWLAGWIWPGAVADSPEVVAVGFHSAFNVLGVILVLPFTAPFGRMIEHLFPERAAPLAAPFDEKLLEEPSAALAGLESGCRRSAGAILQWAAATLDAASRRSDSPMERPAAVLAAVERGREFAVSVGRGKMHEAEIDAERVFACIHLLDHVGRLAERSQDPDLARVVRADRGLAEKARTVADIARRLAERIVAGSDAQEAAAAMVAAAEALEKDEPHFRRRTIRSAPEARGITGDVLDDLLDAHRWLRRMTYHAGRIGHYAGLLSERSPG